jgi:hypothetical protein
MEGEYSSSGSCVEPGNGKAFEVLLSLRRVGGGFDVDRGRGYK